MDQYIGMDVSDKKVSACVVQDGRPDRFAEMDLDMDTLKRWVDRQRQSGDRLHLTFEVSGQAGGLYDGLVDCVECLVVGNPYEMTWIYRTRKKSDRIDAQKQARLLQMGLIPAVHMPSVDVRQWRGEIQHRRRLMGASVKLKNRIRALIKNHGYRQTGCGGGWWKQGNRVWMESLGQANEMTWGAALVDMLEQLALTEKQIRRATRRLDERLKGNERADRLMTIPGVGPRTTEAVLAFTDDVKRFGSGKAYGSYFGMTPKLDQSGQMCRQGHISKQGPSAVRWLITESAWRAIRKSPGLATFYQRVQHGQAKRKKIAIVATARKLLSIMRAMLMHGTEFVESRVLQSKRETIRAKVKTFYN